MNYHSTKKQWWSSYGIQATRTLLQYIPSLYVCTEKNVLEALLWLKKHNPFYANVSIREDNLDWMQGEKEVSIATNAEKFETKNSK